MLQIHKRISVAMTLLCMLPQAVWAAVPAVAPAPISQVQQQIMPAKIIPAILQNVRYNQSQEKVRIVFDVSTLPTFASNLTEYPDQLVIDFEGTVNKIPVPQLFFDDQFVSSLQVSEVETGKQRVTIDLKNLVKYEVFALKNPNRIVVDIIKDLNQKREQQIAPGIKYLSFLSNKEPGPISGHLLDIAPGSDYMIKPVLSNDAIAGLERLKAMAERNKAIAAVNGSYFALNGEILGLLKIDGEIVSTSDEDRTGLGLLGDGKVLIDPLVYKGSVNLPNGATVAITGVNHERGSDELILYNKYYGSMTGTNSFGSDYLVKNGKIIGIAHGNPAIPLGGVVLSAHGLMEEVMSSLKVGDTVKINQTLGDEWDKTTYAIGAGPRLLRNGNVSLTSKEEHFPADITTGRAPRTAVGVTKDGHILLLVVDGRQKYSVGMTLQELALLLQEYGAVDAMNLDGGGSSEMYVTGRVVNKPSDGRERSVGDALIIVPRK